MRWRRPASSRPNCQAWTFRPSSQTAAAAAAQRAGWRHGERPVRCGCRSARASDQPGVAPCQRAVAGRGRRSVSESSGQPAGGGSIQPTTPGVSCSSAGSSAATAGSASVVAKGSMAQAWPVCRPVRTTTWSSRTSTVHPVSVSGRASGAGIRTSAGKPLSASSRRARASGSRAVHATATAPSPVRAPWATARLSISPSSMGSTAPATAACSRWVGRGGTVTVVSTLSAGCRMASTRLGGTAAASSASGSSPVRWTACWRSSSANATRELACSMDRAGSSSRNVVFNWSPSSRPRWVNWHWPARRAPAS